MWKSDSLRALDFVVPWCSGALLRRRCISSNPRRAQLEKNGSEKGAVKGVQSPFLRNPVNHLCLELFFSPGNMSSNTCSVILFLHDVLYSSVWCCEMSTASPSYPLTWECDQVVYSDTEHYQSRGRSYSCQTPSPSCRLWSARLYRSRRSCHGLNLRLYSAVQIWRLLQLRAAGPWTTGNPAQSVFFHVNSKPVVALSQYKWI